LNCAPSVSAKILDLPRCGHQRPSLGCAVAVKNWNSAFFLPGVGHSGGTVVHLSPASNVWGIISSAAPRYVFLLWVPVPFCLGGIRGRCGLFLVSQPQRVRPLQRSDGAADCMPLSVRRRWCPIFAIPRSEYVALGAPESACCASCVPVRCFDGASRPYRPPGCVCVLGPRP